MASMHLLARVLTMCGLALAGALPLAAQDAPPAAQNLSCELPRSAPADHGLSKARVDALVERARAARSDALVLLKNGRIVGEWYFAKEPGPIQTMSATKSVVSMAIGRLLETGAIASLDVPVHEFYPEWRQGRKREITLRMLLNHTSGLQNVPNAGAEIYPAPDAVQLALSAELTHDPGTHFDYNNKAVNLIAGLVEKAAGMKLDVYVQREIFTPLCIPPRFWYKDKAGNPHAMAGVELTPMELAKLGQLMLNGGVWNGRRLLSAQWMKAALAPSERFPRVGLLWWLDAAHGSYRAEGFLGQHLVVVPDEELVAVRMKRQSDDHRPEHNFMDFEAAVREMLEKG